MSQPFIKLRKLHCHILVCVVGPGKRWENIVLWNIWNSDHREVLSHRLQAIVCQGFWCHLALQQHQRCCLCPLLELMEALLDMQAGNSQLFGLPRLAYFPFHCFSLQLELLQTLTQRIPAGELEYRISIVLLLLRSRVDDGNIADFGNEIIES